jgi:hypothetical protein
MPEGPVPAHPASFSWPPPPTGEPVPWEQMERIGFSTGFTRTIGLAFQRVDEFADRIALTRVLFPPLVFALLITAVTALFEAVYSVGAMRMFGQAFEDFEQQMPRLFGPDGFPSERNVLLSHGMRVMLYPVMAFIWAGVVHLGLRIFGRPAHAFAVTFRVVNYAMAPLILTVVPVCGNIVGWVWVLFLTIRSLARAQRVGGATAFAAVILPMVGVCFWMVVANVGAMFRALTQFGGSF